EDVLLAGDADGLDLAGRGSCLQPCEGLAELGEGRRAQRARAGVIATVVERDQGEDLARGETDVAHRGVRDDLSLGQRHDCCEVYVVVSIFFLFFPSKNGFSQMTEPPCPRPTHIAVRP